MGKCHNVTKGVSILLNPPRPAGTPPPEGNYKTAKNFDGQEVENNQTNCAAYSIYSRALLTFSIRSICHRHTKNGASAPFEHIPTLSNGLLDPINRIPADILILSKNRNMKQGKKSYFSVSIRHPNTDLSVIPQDCGLEPTMTDYLLSATQVLTFVLTGHRASAV